MFLRNYWYVAASDHEVGRSPMRRVILRGRALSAVEREAMSLPADADLISVDRKLIRAIKEML